MDQMELMERSMEEYGIFYEKDMDFVEPAVELIEYENDLDLNRDREKEKFECFHCKATFETKPFLADHIKLQHLDKHPHEQKSTPPTINYEQIQAPVHQRFEPNVQYVELNTSFVQQNSTNIINYDKFRCRLFICDICKLSFATQSALSNHKITHSMSGFKCKDCNLLFDKRYNLTLHFKRMHAISKDYECKVCNLKFFYHEYKSHMNAVHTEKSKESNFELKCEICNHLFSSLKAAKAHIVGMHNNRLNHCESYVKSLTKK